MLSGRYCYIRNYSKHDFFGLSLISIVPRIFLKYMLLFEVVAFYFKKMSLSRMFQDQMHLFIVATLQTLR